MAEAAAQAAAKRRMKLGFMPATAERSLNGQTPRYRDYAEMAQLAEQVGFDSFWLADHLLYRFPKEEDPEAGAWEVFTLLSALAATTSAIQLGPLVACTSFRNPALLAKMAAGIDEISNGRFILGLGAGWHEPEYTAFGYPFDHLASRFDEALQVIVPLLREGRVDFKGQYYESPNNVLLPRGPSRNGPPIWIGATRPRMLELVARYADAYNSVWHTKPEQAAERFNNLRLACEKVGRDPATIQLTAGVIVRLLAPGEAPKPEEKSIAGSAEEVATALRGFAEIGVQHLVVITEPNGVPGIERFARVIELLDAQP